MLEQLKYMNHLHEVFEFGKDGIFVDENNLHDYSWNVTKKNNRISALDYTVTNKSLPIVIICNTAEEGITARNKLFEVVEKDVLALQYGRIIVGDYYFKCYVTKSQKEDYLLSRRYMRLTLTLTTDAPYWVKETSFSFSRSGDGSGGSSFLDFAFDYPIDYAPNAAIEQVNNTGFVAANFRLVIYGPCSSPAVYINNHLYQVNCAVLDGEYLTIDSVTKKIMRTQNDGTSVNEFKNRNKESYIFEKIPAGVVPVSWEGDFGFDVVLLEERSEPKWI